MSIANSVYRLIGLDGRPHPILDTQYESMEAAIRAVRKWNSDPKLGCIETSAAIGVEVLTSNGTWRTVLYS